jgi:hypothetical protein
VAADLDRAQRTVRSGGRGPRRCRPSGCPGWATCSPTRFRRTGSTADLDRAIARHEEAVLAAPSQSLLLSRLGAALRLRFERTGALADLYRAITVGEEALAATRPDDRERGGRLSTLGDLLAVRFDRGAPRPTWPAPSRSARVHWS